MRKRALLHNNEEPCKTSGYQRVAYVASVSVRFRSTENQRNGIFGIFARAKNGARAKKRKEGEQNTENPPKPHGLATQAN